MFGFLELEDDPEVARALLDAAEAWLRERGRDRMVGPMDFTMNDESGVLVEGHDREPIDQAALAPAVLRGALREARAGQGDGPLMWDLDIADREKILPVIFELAEQVEPKHGITCAHDAGARCAATWTASPRSTTRPGGATGASCPTPRRTSTTTPRSCSWSSTRTGSWSPRSDGETVGVAITVPDINQVLRRMDGRLLPLGWWHFLRRR